MKPLLCMVLKLQRCMKCFQVAHQADGVQIIPSRASKDSFVE